MSKYILIAALLAGSAQSEEVDVARTLDGESRYTVETDSIRWTQYKGQQVVGASGFGYGVGMTEAAPAVFVVAGCAAGFGTIYYRFGSGNVETHLWRRDGAIVYDIVATRLCMSGQQRGTR